MDYVFEILFAFLISYFFIKKEKPKLRFLFYGYFFYIITLFIQIPFRFLEYSLKNYFNSGFLLPFILIGIMTIVVSEVSKYISLGRFLKTKSYKNGILFGIGWTSLESINFISSSFFKFFFSFFNINYTTSNILMISSFVNFAFFFILNLAITVFIVISIIRNKKLYVFYAILFSIISYFGLLVLSNISKWIFVIGLLIYSFYVIFNYRKLK